MDRLITVTLLALMAATTACSAHAYAESRIPKFTPVEAECTTDTECEEMADEAAERAVNQAEQAG